MRKSQQPFTRDCPQGDLLGTQYKLTPINKLISDHEAKINSLEEITNNAETVFQQLETTQDALKKENNYLKQKVEQLENHSRKFNVRVFRLTNRVEPGKSNSLHK